MAKVREGVVLSGLSGRTGNAVFVSTARGTILRDRPLVNDPKTALQQAVRLNLARVGQRWKSLSLAEAAAWRRYAELEAGPSSEGAVRANLVFTRLAMKFLQMHPGAAVPVAPPATLFPGDAVRFSLLPPPGAGAVRVVGDRDNAPGVVTEVLLQPLLSVHRRTYLSRYRTAGFFAFQAGVPVEIPTESHVNAVAVRFVCAATGQAGPLMELGIAFS